MKTTQEMIEVMQAYVDGKPIQYSGNGYSNWYDAPKPIWDWYNYIYRIKPEEPKPTYRPYKDTDEMVEDFKKRIIKNCSKNAMPLIWIRDTKQKHLGVLITDYGIDCVWLSGAMLAIDLLELYRCFTYLDGSPCGKLVE